MGAGRSTSEPQDQTLPTVSVVIPTWNRASTISDMLEPLLAAGEAIEVLVIDDGSIDETRSVLDRIAADHPVLEVISTVNTGASRARQVGIERARGDVVLIMDDDVLARPGLVRGHAQRHAGRSKLLVVGYMPTTRPSRMSAGGYATSIYADAYEEHCDEWEANAESILDKLWMGNVSLRTEDARRVGMGTSGGYHADRDFGLRCAKAGMEAVFDRSLAAVHNHRRTLKSFRADGRSQGASNFDVYRAHADVLGEFDERYKHHGRLGVSAVIGSVRFTVLYTIFAATTSAGVWAAGRFGLHKMGIRGALLLNRIEAQRGYIERSRTYVAL